MVNNKYNYTRHHFDAADTEQRRNERMQRYVLILEIIGRNSGGMIVTLENFLEF